MFDPPGARNYFEELTQTIPRMPFEAADRLVRIFLDAYEQERTIFLFGNGGSASLASHMACDLSKGTSNGSKKRLRALSLTDNVPLLTAWANDSSYENIFAQQLETFLHPGDVACAISGSGNSSNVLAALRVARNAGVITTGITGFHGGKMKALCDLCVIVPSSNMQIIEDLHLSIAHAVFTAVRRVIHQPSEIEEIPRPTLVSNIVPANPRNRRVSGSNLHS